MKNEKEVMDVVICPPCGESTATSGVRGAYKATSLMSPSIGPADHFLRKGGRNGFTLIELLVVVLIIGILAAVAVPQYRVAVAKAQLSSFMAAVDGLKKAEEVYYLANGEYTIDLRALDIEPPFTNCTYSQSASKGTQGNGKYKCDNGKTVGVWNGAGTVQAGDGKLRYVYYLADVERQNAQKGNYGCFAQEEAGRKACKLLGNGIEYQNLTSWSYVYIISD